MVRGLHAGAGAAVSEGRRLGSLGLGAITPAQARELVAQTRAWGRPARSTQPVLPCAGPRRCGARAGLAGAPASTVRRSSARAPPAALREIYLSFWPIRPCWRRFGLLRPAVVSFHFGLPPAEWIERLCQAAIRTPCLCDDAG